MENQPLKFKQMSEKLKLFLSVLMLKFSDIRIERNVKQLINAIIKGKTTKLKTISKDTKEYEKFHTLLNGELKNVLDAEKLNEVMGLAAAHKLSGRYNVFVIHDESDIRKKYSKKLENLGVVRDLDGKWIGGYSTYNIILIDTQNNKINLYPILLEILQFYKTKESIEAMQKAIKILAFGLDYRKYIKFRLLIPEPMWFGGDDMPKVHLSNNATIYQNDLDFCVGYLIECALKLQEFDFEIEDGRFHE